MKTLSPAPARILALAALAGGIALAGDEAPSTQPAGGKYPLWDGKETQAEYAKRAGIQDVEITLDLGKGVKMKLILIPAGQFTMGADKDPKEVPEPYPPRGGKTYLICNANAGLACVDPADGRILWKVPGGGSGSPVVNNDVAVLFGTNENTGLVAYKIAPEKAEKRWSLPYADRGTSAIPFEGYMYSVGGLKNAKALCVAVSDGKPAWEEAKGFEKAEINSPILADDKIIMFMGLTTRELVMFQASPEKFEALARAKVETSKQPSCNCTSPSIVDGRLFLRLNERVVCYDLRK